MLAPDDVEQLVAYTQHADRAMLIRHFRNCPAPFPVDFTDTFLTTLSIDRLRHLFLALCLQARYLPPEAHTPRQNVA